MPAQNLMAFVREHTISRIEPLSVPRAATGMDCFLPFLKGIPDPDVFRTLVDSFRQTSAFDPMDGRSYNVATIASGMSLDRNDATRFMVLAGAVGAADLSPPGTIVRPVSPMARDHKVARGDLEMRSPCTRPMTISWARFHDPCADYT